MAAQAPAILTPEQIKFLDLVSAEKSLCQAMKPRARDFIDVYFIIKEKGYSFYDLFIQAKAKFDWPIDPIQFGRHLLEASGTSDYPRMLKPIKHEEWKQFFVEETAKFKKKIFE